MLSSGYNCKLWLKFYMPAIWEARCYSPFPPGYLRGGCWDGSSPVFTSGPLAADICPHCPPFLPHPPFFPFSHFSLLFSSPSLALCLFSLAQQEAHPAGAWWEMQVPRGTRSPAERSSPSPSDAAARNGLGTCKPNKGTPHLLAGSHQHTTGSDSVQSVTYLGMKYSPASTREKEQAAIAAPCIKHN